MTFTLNRGFGLPCRLSAASEQELASKLLSQMPTQPAELLHTLAAQAWAHGQAGHGLISLEKANV